MHQPRASSARDCLLVPSDPDNPPVFVDPSGRRAGWVRLAFAAVGGVAALYVATVVLSLLLPAGALHLSIPGLGPVLAGPGPAHKRSPRDGDVELAVPPPSPDPDRVLAVADDGEPAGTTTSSTQLRRGRFRAGRQALPTSAAPVTSASPTSSPARPRPVPAGASTPGPASSPGHQPPRPSAGAASPAASPTRSPGHATTPAPSRSPRPHPTRSHG